MSTERLFVGVSAFSILMGCADFSTSALAPASGEERLDVGGRVEVFSWWTSGGELEAFEALLSVHEDRVSDAEVTNAAVEFADKAREQLALRFAQGVPPDTFQTNTGADLMTWVLTGGLGDQGAVVERLDDLSAALDWQNVFDPYVYDSITYEGHVYAVPVNVHRINSLFYRSDLLEEFGLSPPETIAELFSVCEKIQQTREIQQRSPSGKMSCLAIGNKWNWTMSMMTFEMIFPAVAGPEDYESYFAGKQSAVTPAMKEALHTALTLYCGGAVASDCLGRTYFNSDINDVTWDRGVRKLSEGTAIFAPMGDWAKGYLESTAGGSLKAGVDFDVVPFPGSRGTFVFAADSFALPRGAQNRDGARSFFKTVSSVEAQIAFNRSKGSIPARVDIPEDEFDEVTRQTMREFRSAKKVRALSGLLPGIARDALHPELAASLKAESTEIIERSLIVNYPFE